MIFLALDFMIVTMVVKSVDLSSPWQITYRPSDVPCNKEYVQVLDLEVVLLPLLKSVATVEFMKFQVQELIMKTKTTASVLRKTLLYVKVNIRKLNFLFSFQPLSACVVFPFLPPSRLHTIIK